MLHQSKLGCYRGTLPPPQISHVGTSWLGSKHLASRKQTSQIALSSVSFMLIAQVIQVAMKVVLSLIHVMNQFIELHYNILQNTVKLCS